MSLVLTDAQWNAYSANRGVDQQGDLVIAPRFIPPVYIDVDDTMNSVVLFVTKSNNDQRLEWINSEEALKQAIIKSLGTVVTQVIQSPVDGFSLMSCMDIMNRVRARYGTMQQDVRTTLDERMATRLQSTEQFDTHVSNLVHNFAISEIGGFPILEDRRVKIFRETVYGHPLIAKAVEKFDFDFPDSRLHTFDDISAFVVVNLPNLKNASKVAAQATANIMSSEVYLTLEAENKVLKASLQQPSGKNKDNKRRGGKGKAKGDKSNNKGDRGNKKSKASHDQTKPLKYCHTHGSPEHAHVQRMQDDGCGQGPVLCSHEECQKCVNVMS